jgi:hypothetical protein
LIVVVGARGEETISRRLQKFTHTPDVIRDSSGHRGRDAKRFVDAAKVVEGEPASDGSPMVFPFLTEGVREARHCESP